MADQKAHDAQPGGFSTYFLGMVALGVVAIVVAWLVLGAEFAIPILVLAVLCTVVAIAYRGITSKATSAADSSQGGLAKQPVEGERPLGDTTQAHDEISPHDIPKDSPARQAAEELASGSGAAGTTRGHEAGANETDGDVVGPDERQGAQLPT